MKIKLLSIMLILLLLAACAGRTPDRSIPGGRAKLGAGMFDSCLSPEEAELAALINRARAARGLPAVPVTASLHAVAKWHVIDLSLHTPHLGKTDDRGKQCTLHSWSPMGKGRGEWQALCYTSDHRYSKGMWSKPREVTGYPAEGFENIYTVVQGSDLKPVIPATVLAKWESSPSTGDLMYELGIWRNSNWKAMGIGIHGSYASLWFGNLDDDRGEVTGCSLKK